jgi:hypothetical protein
MSFEIWIGTPNHLDKAVTKATWREAQVWVRDYLDDSLLPQVRKYQNAAVPRINEVRELMMKAHPQELPLSWTFNYLDITHKLEMRKT